MIVPDSDAALLKIQPKQGEGVLLYDQKDFADHEKVQKLVTADTGKEPKDDTYAIVDDKDDVVGLIVADPLCGDTLPQKELVKANKKLVAIGDKYSKATGAFTKKNG